MDNPFPVQGGKMEGHQTKSDNGVNNRPLNSPKGASKKSTPGNKVYDLEMIQIKRDNNRLICFEPTHDWIGIKWNTIS